MHWRTKRKIAVFSIIAGMFTMIALGVFAMPAFLFVMGALLGSLGMYAVMSREI